MYTVKANYFGTGNGTTYMLLITRGYGPDEDPKVNALRRFTELFGDYMAQGAEVINGISFDVYGAKYLLSEDLKRNIIEWEREAGGLEYHASLHVNFS